jgi:hypothetical protein
MKKNSISVRLDKGKHLAKFYKKCAESFHFTLLFLFIIYLFETQHRITNFIFVINCSRNRRNDRYRKYSAKGERRKHWATPGIEPFALCFRYLSFRRFREQFITIQFPAQMSNMVKFNKTLFFSNEQVRRGDATMLIVMQRRPFSFCSLEKIILCCYLIL